MPPKSRAGNAKAKPRKNDRKQPTKPQQRTSSAPATSGFELKALPLTLQQAILNVFKHALDRPFALRRDLKPPPDSQAQSAEQERNEEETKPLSELVQLVKSHLYNRDFDAAFADADGELLRAYALRWSAGRALAYAGIFGYVLDQMSSSTKQHVISIGGGAGAELVGLAAAWKDCDGEENKDGALTSQMEAVSLEDSALKQEDAELRDQKTSDRSLTIVDIADWSAVIEQLNNFIQSGLLQKSSFKVDFHHADILNYTEDELTSLIGTSTSSATLVTLMFTLNELFTVSIPKTTKFLLQLTDAVKAGTLLLVVDSPGSYSTVSLGTSKDGEEKPQRTYPMRFLLDHTLLTIAEGRWECVVSEPSKWFRRDETRLRYWVGDGVGLEDMRFQLHLYRKLDG
ncbi:hypothetical protein AAP_02526 [Ascosphaera apis ARSEF 7405]|uniref:25S rRNA (Uridine(2843)-N(3))-methyltransferase n=1 Tax=Ascosphaera apis ARSEF 7405 TaxID=392613 RepID=A0A166NXK4_9EURO|nr:hypothetical protein AAP_02526 [Ascosphaera apis ARSEF 7405]